MVLLRLRHRAERRSPTRVERDDPVRLAPGVDNESCLTWLDGALEQAIKRRKPGLYAYLEAVLEEVLFETGSQHPEHARD